MSASRRRFIAAGLALPAAASASRTEEQAAPPRSPARPPSSGPAFQYKTLGKTGLKVTTVGFGCMITSDQSVVERGADLGITYFDTARGYQGGNNERMVGAALKRKRKDLVLSTKTQARTKADALANIDTSLKELGTDYVDIWYLHAKSSPDQITPELIEAQQEAKKAGKIRVAGVSTHGGQKELMPALVKNPHVDVILTSYNFTMEPFMAGLLEEAAKAGKGIVAMKVMAGGLRRIQKTDPAFEKLSREGAMLSALKWVLQNPNVQTTIPSITDMDQLDENLKAMSERFGESDKKLLAVQMQRIAPLYCRMCGQCDGQCRQGLPVADVLRYVTYADGYGQFGLGRERFQELSAEQMSVKCADCPGCTVECPYGVRVAGRVARAQELFAC